MDDWYLLRGYTHWLGKQEWLQTPWVIGFPESEGGLEGCLVALFAGILGNFFSLCLWLEVWLLFIVPFVPCAVFDTLAFASTKSYRLLYSRRRYKTAIRPSSLTPSTLTCWGCGHIIPSDARHCAYCGRRVKP